MPTRILILANFPKDSIKGQMKGRSGGGATWLPQLADAFFTHKDFEFIWITLDNSITKEEMFEHDNQTFIRLPVWKYSIYFLLRHWPVRRKIRRWIKKYEPDLVHVWGTEHPYSAVFEGLSIPKIISVQGLLTEFGKVWDLNWQLRIQARLEPKRFQQADVITCESMWSMEGVKKIVPQADVRVVEYGVHPSFYDAHWQPDPEDPYMMCIGSLDRRKGTDVLLDALEICKERKWRCLIAGDGPMKDELVAREIPRVEYLGILGWKELQHLMTKAWALVVPTRADTGPTVVKEARVVGLPVIGTIHGGLRDYIRQGESGYIVNPLNAENLAEACSDVMRDFETTKHMGESGHSEDRVYFRSENTAANFVEIYKDLLKI